MLISPKFSSSESNPFQSLPLGIMASGSGTNFEAVARAIANGQLNAEIKVLIYNNPQAKVRSLGERYDIPTILINHREYKTREDLDRAIVSTLQQCGVEWVVMAGWMRVVTEVLIASFPNRIINIHPSLLPSFKGIRAVEKALEAKVKITGCTAHLVTLEVDSGEILIQAAVPVYEEDTPATLHARIQEQEHLILPRAIALAAFNYFKAIENFTD